MKPTLYLIRGVPGSGKSTFAQSLLDKFVVQRMYEADQYFVQNGEYQFDP
jgi:uridine kinase